MAGPTQESMMQNTANIPSAAAPQAAPENPAAMLEKLVGFGGQSNDIMKLAREAATPIPGGHATQMPANLMYQPKQDQPGQLDHREVVGAGNARAQGIGNSVIGVMNLVSHLKTQSDNKKRLQLATDTATLLNAQQQVDQAKQYLGMLPENDPRRKQYQSVIDSNMQRMNTILSDEKTRKAIGEGFKIDFTNPKEMTEENHAVMQGKEMAKQMTNADRFMQQTPQSLQPNLPAQAAYSAQAMQQKYQAETMRAIVPLLTAQMRGEVSMSNEKLRQTMANARESARLSVLVDVAVNRIKASKDLQSNKFAHDFDMLHERAAETRKTGLALLNARNLSKDDYDKQMLQFNAAIDRTSNSIKGYKDSMHALIAPNGSITNQREYDEYKVFEQGAEQELKNLNLQRDGFKTMFQERMNSKDTSTPTDSSTDSSDTTDSTDDMSDITNIMNWANLQPEQ